MKAEKYRIGNFVKFNNQTIKLTPKYFKSLDTFKCIDSLILNEKWLVDFGFINKGTDLYYKYRREKDGIYTIYCMYGTIKIRNLHGFVKDLKYVHELQNLYFALTNKELELIK
jgi:hypothetical protein